MKNPPPRDLCSFCAREIAEVELLFRSSIGGEPPAICDTCVEDRMAIIEQERKAPGFAADLIEAQRARIAKRWRDTHP
jgi:ClpX C4-type zinc finger